MPFTVKSAEKHNKSLKTAKQKRQWAAVANQQLASCIKDGGTDKSCAPKAIRIANGVVKKSMEQSMDDELKNLQDGDFLVLAEESRHLPVRIQGEPNRKLAGMAWAHLFGDAKDAYKGPGKAAAKASLRALYRETQWETPVIEDGVFYDPEGVIAEYHDYDVEPSNNDGKARRVPWGVVTFEDLDKAQELAALGDRLDIRVDQFQTMFWRIWGNVSFFGDGPTPAEARTEWIALFKEFITVFETEAEIAADGDQANNEPQIEEVEFSESATMGNAVILEDNLAESSADPDRSFLSMNIEMIQPGWGNKRDNHWYPRSVLKRDAPRIFKGIKMYTTNHREGERSERTEVAQIEEIVDFSATGAPIAKVIVFDPLFAEKTRNRARAGKLASLECSILASGSIKKGMVDGREANIVETITSAKAVDFVTSGGAGGRATSLNESELAEFSELGDEIMNEKPEKDASQETPVEEQEPETTKATFSEKDTGEGESQEEQEQEPEVTFLNEAEVSTCLNGCNLPSPSKVRLAQVSYETVDALAEAITQETEYVKVLTASGKPKSSAASASKKPVPTKTLEEINAAKDAVNAKWIGARPALKKS